jgi:hypothetical protein
MSIQRSLAWLVACLTLVGWAGLASAQVPANSNLNYSNPTQSWENGSPPFAESAPRSHRFFQPFHPVGFEPQWDWFAPAETSTYGNGPRAHIGYFGSYERLYWSLSKPTRATIGSETATGPRVNNFSYIEPDEPPQFTFPAINTLDTGFMQANGAWGNRWEVGYMDTDNYGWLVSVLDHVSQGQYKVAEGASIQFNDPLGLLTGYLLETADEPRIPIGKMAVNFDTVLLKNQAYLNGVELMRMYRAPRLHHGGYFELLYGVRWLQLSDTQYVIAFENPNVETPFPNPLTDSSWSTRATNNLIGPQIGARLFKQAGRWVTSLEGRFLAAANFQNVQQQATLGDRIELISAADSTLVGSIIPSAMTGMATKQSSNATTFSPMGELRVNVALQATSNVALTVGYTGMVIGNITRASNRVSYDGPNLIGITDGGEHQLFFANGLNFGVTVNR